MFNFCYRLRSSLENIVDVPDDEEPLVTFPDESSGNLELELRPSQLTATSSNELFSNNDHSADTLKFEEKRMMSASKTKVIKDGFSSEQVIIKLFIILFKILLDDISCFEFVFIIWLGNK